MFNKSMRHRFLYGVVVAGIASSLQAATITVSKTGTAAFHTIQEAIDAAGENDTILIKDSDVYEECVTVASKKNLVVMSDPSLTAKPSIVYTDKLNVGPKNCTEALDTSKITFFKNGALRIMESTNIVLKGIIINGKEVYPFGYPAVWSDLESCRWPMQSGNTAIVLFQSYNVTIDNCDITNAFYGIYIDGFVRSSSGSIDILSTSPMESSIGYTGNHLITNNRIHHNTYGIFLENESDHSTIISQNLFYENHHQSDTTAQIVKNLTSEGLNLPGGAIFFKNSQKTPLAIYNNTFYNNYLLLVAGWRPGSHYLIFNNIYAKPYRYWSDDKLYNNPFFAADPAYVNRTFNSLFACQTAAPMLTGIIITRYDSQNSSTVILDTVMTYQPRIMNSMDQIERTDMHLTYGDFDTVLTGVKMPGNRILSSIDKAFPSAANVRWLEPVFKSTDPSSNDFLVPDWNDSLMHRLVVDQGWTASGVRDADGSIADIGAIPYDRTAGSTRVRIMPVNYITESAPEQISFILGSDSPLTDCRIDYCRLVDNSVRDTNSFGGTFQPLALSNIHEVATTGVITTGFNQISCEIKNKNQSLKSGFFELIISGVNSQGIRVSSTPGFLPVSVPETADFDISFNDLDSGSGSNDLVNKKVEFALTPKPGASKAFYKRASLKTSDGSPVVNIHGKPVYFDSLSMNLESISSNGKIRYADTFTVKSKPAYGVLPVFFKALIDESNKSYTYSAHLLNVGKITPVKNNQRQSPWVNNTIKPEFVAMYDLMGKRVSIIPYTDYAQKRFPGTMTRGMYIVKLLKANKREISARSASKIVIR